MPERRKPGGVRKFLHSLLGGRKQQHPEFRGRKEIRRMSTEWHDFSRKIDLEKYRDLREQHLRKAEELSKKYKVPDFESYETLMKKQEGYINTYKNILGYLKKIDKLPKEKREEFVKKYNQVANEYFNAFAESSALEETTNKYADPLYVFKTHLVPEKEVLLFTEDVLGRFAMEELNRINNPEIRKIYSTIDDYVDYISKELMISTQGISLPSVATDYLKNHLKSRISLFLDMAKDVGALEEISTTLRTKLEEYFSTIKNNKEGILEYLRNAEKYTASDDRATDLLMKSVFFGIDSALYRTTFPHTIKGIKGEMNLLSYAFNKGNNINERTKYVFDQQIENIKVALKR